MASVTATINVQINAANAAAQLTALQSKVAAMNKGMLAATAGGVMAQEKAIRRMGTVLSGSGMFTTGIRNVHTELGRMHQEFDRGSTSLQNYRKNSRMWGKDHSNINRMAADRVRMLQSQYVALGKEMNGVQKAMQIKPDRMMREFGADAEYAHQRAMLFRRNLQMGSTALVNWGKNTQWAGRQMMVGMGIPIAIAAGGAVKAFNDIEKSSIAFKRVYGDATTSVAEKSQMLVKVQKTVGNEMMKYGIAMSDTLDVSAKAAATGAKGADLIAATRETMRLATLGNMDYNKALEATIAMQTAFNINSKDMAKTTDFLNAVENQTILSMEDMALAVPRVAPVIKGLGGNVEELAIMMTALRQGGVSAEQGANALKSGLGSLLNPTGTAIEQFDQMGINLKKIVETNKGDLIGTIQGLGKALDGLSKYDRQRALESLFGKYQYARMGALLKNINSKAVKETMRLAKAGNAELAKMSEQELGQISDSPMIKLRASIEELKAAAAPLGALFSDIAAKIVSFATPVVSFFANNDAAKWGLVVGAGLAALAGTLTMIIGVFANFAGSMVKAGMAVRTFFRFITGQRSLAYVTTDGLEASAAANSLATAAERAAGGMMAEAKAAQLLTSQLEALIAAQNGAAATSRAAGTGIVPTTPVRPGGIPTPAQPTTSQLSTAVLSDRYGPPVRAHLEQQVPLNQAQTAALLSEYRGTGTKIEKSLLAATAPGAAGVMGYIPQSLGWGSKTNNRLSLDDSAMVPRQELLDQLRGRPEQVIAPFLDDVARNAGLTREQVYSDPRVQQWARNATDQMIQRIETSPLEGWKDTDVASHSRGILGTVAGIGPEYAGAWGRMQTPELLNADGNKFNVTQKLSERFPNLFSAWRKKSNARKGVLTGTEQVVADADRYLKLPPSSETPPVIPVDSSGRPQAVILPEGSKAGSQVARTAEQILKQTPAARITPNNQGALPSSPIGARPVTPTPVDPDEANKRSRFGTRGMGLMGAGMLAQTAIMGLEMAGKEVPNAVNFAVNGLMGIGMASMFFPDMMPKLATGLSTVAASLGPLGIAIGATAAVVGGGIILWKKFNDNTRQRGIDLGRALNSTTEYIEETGNAFGRTSYVTKRAAEEAGVSTEQLNAAQQYLQSDIGRKFVEDYASTASQSNFAIAGSSAAAKIASYVVNGVMGTRDVKSFLAALKVEDPTMGNIIASQMPGLLGKGMKNNPAQVAQNILAQQQMNTQAMNEMMRKQAESLISADNIPASQAQDKPSFWDTWLQALSGAGGGPGGSTGALAAQTAQGLKTQTEYRGAINANAGLLASANISQIQTALQNRLAVEAQINALLDERKTLREKPDKTEDEKKRLEYLRKNLPKVQSDFKEFTKQTNASARSMIGLWDAAEGDAQRGALMESASKVLRDSGDMNKIMGEGLIRSSDMGDRGKYKMMTKLATGGLDPSGFINMFNNSTTGVKGVSQAINGLPTTKLQEFSQGIGSLKDPGRALTNFGSAFKKIGKDAGLTVPQMENFVEAIGGPGALAKYKNASKEQEKVNSNLAKARKEAKISDGFNAGKFGSTKIPKELQQTIKRRAVGDKDIDKKPKDQEFTVKAKADVGGAKKDVIDLGAAVDATGKKKINIQARANVGGAERKIKGLGAALGGGMDVEQTVNRVIGTDETKTPAAPLIQLVNRIIAMDMSLIPAAPLVQQILRILTFRPELIPPPPVEQIVRRRVVGGSATGGLFAYANGGVHSGDGKVIGPGGPTDDKVNARLSDGEFVIRASSVQKYGTAFLDAVNRGMYDKNGFAKGSPIKKAPFAPKDKKGESRAVEFGNEWRGMMFEVTSFLKEFSKMNKIIEFGSKKLKGGMKVLDYEFGKYLMDNYSPRQIKKMFKSGQVKKIQRQFTAENKLEARDQLRTGMYDQAAAAMANSQVGRYGGMASAYQGLSGDDMKLAASQPKLFKKIMGQRAAIEKESQIGQFKSQVVGSDAAIAGQLGDSGLAKAAEQLGMSMTDIANAMANGYTAQQIKELGSAAEKAAEQLAIALMEPIDRLSEQADNLGQIVSLYGQKAEAAGRQAVATDSGTWGIDGVSSGMGVNQLNALMGVNQANADIWQGQIDDINKDYEKQLEIFDQISQQQQAIANLERGRLSVANALSQGDIAAAAMAAQQQRSDTASFMQEQMRTQLENQQKAKTLSLQNQIDDALKVNRDIQNQINMAMAIAARDVAKAQDDAQKQADTILIQNTLIDQQIAKLNERNAALAAGGVIPPPPGIPTPDGDASAPTAPPVAQGDVLWNLANSGISRLGDKDFKFIKKQVFKGKDKSNNAWKDAFSGFSSDKKNLLISVVSNGSVSSSEEALIKKKFATGGWVPGTGSRDTVPIMATPGEFVMRKAAAARFGPMLNAMNSGSFKGIESTGGGTSIGSVVFNINGANLNEREVADIAVRKMKSLDSATIRGGRF